MGCVCTGIAGTCAALSCFREIGLSGGGGGDACQPPPSPTHSSWGQCGKGNYIHTHLSHLELKAHQRRMHTPRMTKGKKREINRLGKGEEREGGRILSTKRHNQCLAKEQTASGRNHPEPPLAQFYYGQWCRHVSKH